MPWWPQINNGNLVINTIDNFDDSPTKSANLVDKSDDDIIELEQITIHMAEMMKYEGKMVIMAFGWMKNTKMHPSQW